MYIYTYTYINIFAFPLLEESNCGRNRPVLEIWGWQNQIWWGIWEKNGKNVGGPKKTNLEGEKKEAKLPVSITVRVGSGALRVRAAAPGLKPLRLPLARSPWTGEGPGGDWCSWPMGVKAEGIPGVCRREWKETPASLGYPLSVFNKNFTLKGGWKKIETKKAQKNIQFTSLA